jgi:hypothetical protein
MSAQSPQGPTTAKTDPTKVLAHEARVTYGPVPHELNGIPVAEGEHRLSGSAFLLRTGDGLSYLYRKGKGVTIERGSDFDPQDEALWLNGSVYAALASINGFKPIHASAVAHEGKVYAFTGQSGAGKSTLVAALGACGFPMFCDDTLVLDISDSSQVTCMPGHKRLKLTAEALALTNAAREEEVGASVEKFYALPAAGSIDFPLPLAKLIFLEEGPSLAWEPVTGAQRFARLDDDHYTTDLFNRAQHSGPASQFALQARLARQITMARLIRPRDAARFSETVALTTSSITKEDAIET